MAISTLFFIFLGAALLGFIVAALNMLSAFKQFGSGGRSISSIFGVHILAGIFYVIGGLGAFITGIVWLVQAIKA